ncbi:FGGY-family carbohydrate kinase [Flavisolibacter ginsenosidimutans]|uniref:Carbohydrate kinase n=1 Tax=Flavisolibacter ginsenosidimutans TaxID=661481 RepID=A0A5B8UH86_9BACT|nr:FGGY family carbohydrate kinase [Flavisolibacter ginsenosidimutans]QEC55420.1 carbohydrate kinase [Flavisolibacter ginsenosidimutans]
MRARPVIAVIDVGKTNKKLFLFDQDYNIVYEQSARFLETVDEDGDVCENIESLRLSVFDSLRRVFAKKEFCIKAINFSAYGASFVYLDEEGTPLAPLYNYLKVYPKKLSEKFYAAYGGEEAFSLRTASPVLGSLNSGLQLYRLKHEKPDVFQKTKYALHLPQYLSYLISGKACSDITSIGCHTALWDFVDNGYHEWVRKEGIDAKLAPLAAYDEVSKAAFPGNNYLVGVGLHDSSAALIPYLVNFHEPFILISTGTWCITLNPFNNSPLTADELKQDCLAYLQYQGSPVKASRLFAGREHEEGIKRIAEHFNTDAIKYRSVDFDPEIVAALQKKTANEKLPAIGEAVFERRDLSAFSSYEKAYHQLMLDIVAQQVASTNLVLKGSPVKRLFVDGGFGKNKIYMNLLALAYPNLEVYAASMAQATALGAALAVHKSWNKKPVPNTLITLQYFSAPQDAIV